MSDVVKTFKDLEFLPHSFGNGLQARMDFDNSYGVSVVRFRTFGIGYGSYTDNESQWELAVLRDGNITYDTPITDDVIGYLSSSDVTRVMKEGQALPAIAKVESKEGA